MEDFPKKVFVVRERESDDESYLLLNEDLEDIEKAGEVVAEYHLVRTGELSIKKRLINTAPAKGY